MGDDFLIYKMSVAESVEYSNTGLRVEDVEQYGELTSFSAIGA